MRSLCQFSHSGKPFPFFSTTKNESSRASCFCAFFFNLLLTKISNALPLHSSHALKTKTPKPFFTYDQKTKNQKRARSVLSTPKKTPKIRILVLVSFYRRRKGKRKFFLLLSPPLIDQLPDISNRPRAFSIWTKSKRRRRQQKTHLHQKTILYPVTCEKDKNDFKKNEFCLFSFLSLSPASLSSLFSSWMPFFSFLPVAYSVCSATRKKN